MAECFNLFLLSEGLKGDLKRPLISFVEKDMNSAKLYFKAFIEGDYRYNLKHGLPTVPYTLHWLGVIDKNFTFKPKMIFITNTSLIYEDEREKVNVSQLSIDFASQWAKANRDWFQSRSQLDTVKKVFNGKLVD